VVAAAVVAADAEAAAAEEEEGPTGAYLKAPVSWYPNVPRKFPTASTTFSKAQ
jgi:hypothetical protein